MSNAEAIVRKLLRQQAAIAGFGSFALYESDLPKILKEAARICAEGLGVPYSKICRHRKAEDNLIIEVGHGWKTGVIMCDKSENTAEATSPLLSAGAATAPSPWSKR